MWGNLVFGEGKPLHRGQGLGWKLLLLLFILFLLNPNPANLENMVSS